MSTAVAGEVERAEELVSQSRAVLSKHARSFRLAAFFLPAQATDDAAVVYALCRLIDDLADESPDPAIARLELSKLQAELRQEAVPRPLVSHFLRMAAEKQIEVQAALDLIEGALSDLDPVRISDDAVLDLYCYRVAGTVGLLMCGVLGVTDPTARRHAIALGMAMQLTNLCRDVVEDARMGRVYLPESRLTAEGIRPEGLLAGTADRAALSRVVRALLRRADGLYDLGRAGMGYIPLRSRVAIFVAARLYQGIGHRLVAVHGADPSHGRTILPPLSRLGAVVSGLMDFLKWRQVAGTAALPAPRGS